METRPAPSRLRPDAPDDEPELRTETDREAEAPDRERERRPETERRDVEDRDEREELREDDPEPLRADVLLLPREPPWMPWLALLLLPPAAIPVGGEDRFPFCETTGASPQVSQYISPPPMSSYDPSQPGR
ncbi:hypothetical protein [Streptomyces spiramyceticus]|uniref:hypothetical protein n=1 Tax=Streptomyces spiramyceticus TaxID=299717 RepID=UPI003B75CDB7